jgi:hypothetical protein
MLFILQKVEDVEIQDWIIVEHLSSQHLCHPFLGMSFKMLDDKIGFVYKTHA